MTRTLSWEEIKKHNKRDDCWVVVDGVVYDMTSFLDEHPGGRRLPLKHAGKDASEVWNSLHGHKKEAILKQYMHLRVGVAEPHAGVAEPMQVHSVGTSNPHQTMPFTRSLLPCTQHSKL